MDKQMYFETVNYNGNHLHVDNYKDEYTPYDEGIAWGRQDGSMDLFFYEFETNSEKQVLFVDRGYYTDEFKGGYIATVKSDEDAYAMFQKWVDEVLYPYRNSEGAK